jgi:hypothetical protein
LIERNLHNEDTWRKIVGTVAAAGTTYVRRIDSEDFIALGGHIQFSSWPCSHFEVSNEHLRASGLSAWSQLLRISGAP